MGLNKWVNQICFLKQKVLNIYLFSNFCCLENHFFSMILSRILNKAIFLLYNRSLFMVKNKQQSHPKSHIVEFDMLQQNYLKVSIYFFSKKIAHLSNVDASLVLPLFHIKINGPHAAHPFNIHLLFNLAYHFQATREN